MSWSCLQHIISNAGGMMAKKLYGDLAAIGVDGDRSCRCLIQVGDNELLDASGNSIMMAIEK